jgi:RNA polymerase sigma-70 factor (ECF subfamily)
MRPDVETSDETLAYRASRGDDEAFSALVRRYSRPLYSFIRRYHPDRDDCDDLFQETWIRVLLSLRRFEPGRRFSTWLFQIALNQCRDLARRGQGRNRFQVMAGEMEQERRKPDIEREAETGMVLDAIREMPVSYREVLLLRYYNGFSEAEVSEILGCPRGTVKSRLHQAVKAVRLKLAPEKKAGD